LSQLFTRLNEVIMEKKQEQKQIMIKLTKEQLDKLDEVAKVKYRGLKNRNQIVRWLIEDAFKEMEK